MEANQSNKLLLDKIKDSEKSLLIFNCPADLSFDEIRESLCLLKIDKVYKEDILKTSSFASLGKPSDKDKHRNYKITFAQSQSRHAVIFAEKTPPLDFSLERDMPPEYVGAYKLLKRRGLFMKITLDYHTSISFNECALELKFRVDPKDKKEEFKIFCSYSPPTKSSSKVENRKSEELFDKSCVTLSPRVRSDLTKPLNSTILWHFKKDPPKEKKALWEMAKKLLKPGDFKALDKVFKNRKRIVLMFKNKTSISLFTTYQDSLWEGKKLDWTYFE